MATTTPSVAFVAASVSCPSWPHPCRALRGCIRSCELKRAGS